MAGEAFVAEPGRLDVVVAARLGVPRVDVQRAIEAGTVLVNGNPRSKSFRLAGGERVEAELHQRGDLPEDPEPVPILYEDEHLLVVSKPPHVVAHPTAARRAGTLVNRLLGMGVPLAGGEDPDRPGIVHRLDAGTSGLMVVAKTEVARALLLEMFRRHRSDRRYLALVRGSPGHERFLIDAPLQRQRARIRVRAAGGKEAATEVVVAERMKGSSLVEASPRTGRTHQIRVHLASVGHPILGDRAYGGGGYDAARLGLDRPFLHSWRISFHHPITGESVEIEDPLPEDLERALHRARS